ncbi:MAG: HEAT repeat domain-containing protein, partial [Planctomycetaceae bacterium]|nr:HEAT repeat domain-containing protein [Planctomycetaceae bacterium]
RWTGRDQAEEKLADVDVKAEKASKSKSTDARVPETAGKSKRPTDKSASDAKGETQIADAGGSASKSKVPATDKKGTVTKPTAKPGTELAASDVPKARINSQDESKSEPSSTRRALPRDPFLDEAIAAAEATQSPAREEANIAAPFPDTTPGVAKTARPGMESHFALPAATQNPFEDIKQVGAVAGLPEWALDDAPKSEPQPPTISQIAASQLQPGQLKPGLPAKAPRASGPITPPSKRLASLCPNAQGEVRELVNDLDSSDPETIKRTIHRLGRMQLHAVAAVPALQALTHHNDSFVRVHAALALVRMQQISPAVTDSLIAGLRSPDPAVRSFAAAVLAEMGPQSADAVPALSAALHDADGYVRLHVAEVLIRHANWSYPALQTLLECLKHKDENIRWLATYSLAELAPQSPDAVRALSAALRDPTSKVQIGAAYALGEIGTIASSATSDLQRCKLSDNADLRSAADYALQQIQF